VAAILGKIAAFLTRDMADSGVIPPTTRRSRFLISRGSFATLLPMLGTERLNARLTDDSGTAAGAASVHAVTPAGIRPVDEHEQRVASIRHAHDLFDEIVIDEHAVKRGRWRR
jgi:hypothetical protein